MNSFSLRKFFILLLIFTFISSCHKKPKSIASNDVASGIRLPASSAWPVRLLIKGSNSIYLTIAVVAYTVGAEAGIDFDQLILDSLSLERKDDNIEQAPASPLDPNYQPISNEHIMEIMPMDFVVKNVIPDLHEALPQKNLVDQYKKEVRLPDFEHQLKHVVYSEAEGAHFKHFPVQDRIDLISESLSEAKKIFRSQLNYHTNELPTVQWAYNLLNNVRFVVSHSSQSPSLISDFITCKELSGQAAFVIGVPSKVSTWPLAICHYFNELTHVKGSKHTPGHLGGKILATIMLREAGMSMQRVVELIYKN